MGDGAIASQSYAAMRDDRTRRLNVDVVSNTKLSSSAQNHDVAINSDVAPERHICETNDRGVFGDSDITADASYTEPAELFLVEVSRLQSLNHAADATSTDVDVVSQRRRK